MKMRITILSVVRADSLGLQGMLEDHKWIACDRISVLSKITLWRESKP